MVDIYFGYSNRSITLDIIGNYWNLLNQENKNKFGQVVASIFKKEQVNISSVVLLSDEINIRFNEFDLSTKELIKTNFFEFISKEKSGKEYVKNILNRL